MNWLKRPRWSPYVVGALVGVLSWITFAAMGKALGTSTTMVRIAGGIESVVIPAHVEENAYFTKYLGTPAEPKPIVEWQFALVVFLIVGALLAAKLGGTYRRETVPTLWARRFGESRLKRCAGAFLGGLILLFGARLAGGCTSGHGISGGLQLAVGSWIFTIALFVAGILTALPLFGRKD